MITRSTAVFLLLLFCLTSFGQGDQGRIHITVFDADTNQPIPFANVYLNKTTIGASTNEQGEATVTKIPFGVYQVVISEVGHISQQRDLTISSAEIMNITVKLKAQMLDVVTVVAKHDNKWKHELSRFEKMFFGLDHFKQCEITNPWALEFQDEKGQFTVKSKEPLKIKNDYLGYDLDFMIKNCYFNAETFNITGFARYEEKKGEEKELAKWKKNREKTYRGSPQHFFKTVFDSTFHSDGYEIFTDITGQEKLLRTPILNDNINKAIVRDTIVKRVARRKDGMYNLRLPSRLEIHYQLKSAYPPVYADVNHAISWMEVRKGATVVVNSSGFIQNSNDVRLSGAMSNFRVAEWLPLDYDYAGESTPDLIIPPAKQLALLEKSYVHTDRDYYYNDETMWLKGYMSYVLPNLKDTLSKTVYVELSDATGKVVATKRYAVEDAKFSGDITFGKDWKPGFYQLRAYTSWMLNFDKRLIFSKTVDLLTEKEAVKIPTSYALAADTVPNVWLRTDKDSYSAREKNYREHRCDRQS
ncbi:MAG: carboxypeptidase-like regulatory domain-containing protein [Bacteroidota bacterium]